VVVNGTTTSLTVEPSCWAGVTKLWDAYHKGLPPPPTYLENFPQPPGPGEFFADSQYIFYRPNSPYESPYAPAPTDAFVPNLETLVSSSGTVNHTWSGISFSYSTWRLVSSPGGYNPSQTAVTPAGEPPASVQVHAGRDVTFEGCTFAHIGSPYALSIGDGSARALVSGCTFSDLSGGAVKLGNVNDTRAVTTDPTQWDQNMTLQGCVVETAATEYHGASVVFAGYVRHTTIDHNTIRHSGYTGISLGWGWGRVVSFAADNHVTNNRVESVMQDLNDGGCVYTLGPQPDSTVSGNFCAMDAAPVVGCFYHDNGSRYFTTTNNVADTSPAPCVYLQGCCGAPALDIHVSDLWCRNTAPVRQRLCASEWHGVVELFLCESSSCLSEWCRYATDVPRKTVLLTPTRPTL